MLSRTQSHGSKRTPTNQNFTSNLIKHNQGGGCVQPYLNERSVCPVPAVCLVFCRPDMLEEGGEKVRQVESRSDAAWLLALRTTNSAHLIVCHSAVTCSSERRQVLFPHAPKIREVADQVKIPRDPGQA